jgi:hypothetical protein
LEGFSVAPSPLQEVGGVTGPAPEVELVPVCMREGGVEAEGGDKGLCPDDGAVVRTSSFVTTTGVMVSPITLRREESVCLRIGGVDLDVSRFSAVLVRGIRRLSCFDNRFLDLVLPRMEFERKGFSS